MARADATSTTPTTDVAVPVNSEIKHTGSEKAAKAGEASINQALPAILFWITMSCSTILFNKFLYTGTFAHPLTLSTIHMGFATLATSILRLSGQLVVPELGWSFLAQNVLPIGILFAFSLGFSNLAAIRLSVSFIQMIKALTPMLTLAISVAMGLEKATTTLIAGEFFC